MSVTILFSARDGAWDEYKATLPTALKAAGIKFTLTRDAAPDTVDYMIYAPGGEVADFQAFSKCKAILSLWAGVERIAPDETLTQPLARMVDTSLTQSMVEWVVGHSLYHHLGTAQFAHGQDGQWRSDAIPPTSQSRPLTILGLGELGLACGEALVQLGFPVRGWSRNPKSHAAIACYNGPEGLKEALRDTQGVILLLPDTAATTNIFGAPEMALTAKGAFVLNPGRGPLIDDGALLAALDTGQIGAATLDVFRVEPLPADHPYWAHPKVVVTPHIAAATRPETASEVIAENIRRGEAGEPLLHLVNRKAGY